MTDLRDLLVITPSRGRPLFVRRLLLAWAATSMVRTDIMFAFDDDDPALPDTLSMLGANKGLAKRVRWVTGPRRQLGPWTNQLALEHAHQYRALASLGDDHVPRTKGWDALLVQAVTARGLGYAWPEGYAQPGFPEAVVVSSPIVEALGWFMEPSLQHWYVDQVWFDLARGTQAAAYLGDVIVSHEHVPADATGAESWELLDADRVSYARWLMDRYPADRDTVKKAVGR